MLIIIALPSSVFTMWLPSFVRVNARAGIREWDFGHMKPFFQVWAYLPLQLFSHRPEHLPQLSSWAEAAASWLQSVLLLPAKLLWTPSCVTPVRPQGQEPEDSACMSAAGFSQHQQPKMGASGQQVSCSLLDKAPSSEGCAGGDSYLLSGSHSFSALHKPSLVLPTHFNNLKL